MKMRIQIVLLASGLALCATTPRAPLAIQPFAALPASDHTVRATDLAWLDQGLATVAVGTSSEAAAAVSAPHFQVIYGQRTLSLEDAQSGEFEREQTDRTLRLSTALASSQVGLGSQALDFAVGASFLRDKKRYDEVDAASGANGIRQSVDLSVAVRLDSWRIGGGLLDALDVGSDSGVASDSRFSLDLGRAVPDGIQWGTRLEIPWQAGHEAGFRAGIGRQFRRALDFSAEIGTTYKKQFDSASMERKLMRSSLEATLETSLSLRPRQDSDPDWIAFLVDPLSGGDGSRFLRGLKIGVQGTWDLVRGGGRAAFTLGREF